MNDKDAGVDARHGIVEDGRLKPSRFRFLAMPGPRACNVSVILHADDQNSAIGVGQGHDFFVNRLVVGTVSAIRLELAIDGFSSRDYLF